MSALPRDRLNGRMDAAVAADENIASERGGSHRRPRACGRVGERGGGRGRGRARALAQRRVVEHGGGPTMAELERLSLRWLLRVPLLGSEEPLFVPFVEDSTVLPTTAALRCCKASGV